MARKQNEENKMSKVIKLALQNKSITEENIIKLVSFLSSNQQFSAVEILNGVDEAPEIPLPTQVIRLYSNDCKVIKAYWNPLMGEVICEFRYYNTIRVEHPFTDETDIQLMKEKFFACTSKEQAKGIPMSGPHSLTVSIDCCKGQSFQNNSYSMDQWKKFCK
mgnify:CR=1 FL=1|tara:strand:- start:499 stop:984 length:486 start_codon:yes stop_codon:yes gene_type:complete